jgi:hypothetical protein
MSDKEEYTTIDIEPKDEDQKLAMLILMNEGALRERERIVAILKEELKESLDPIEGTKGGWREHLIARIKGEK